MKFVKGDKIISLPNPNCCPTGMFEVRSVGAMTISRGRRMEKYIIDGGYTALSPYMERQDPNA